MKRKISIVCVIVLGFSVLTFAQLLDSVYYQGPSQGSVVSGAVQTTDNFPTYMEIIPGEDTRVIPNVDNSFNSEPQIMDYDMSKLPEYIYVEDTNAGINVNPKLDVNGGSVLLNKFQGYTATNAIPPDPSMAVGPNHIVATVNGFPSFFRIFDKQGNI